MYAILWKLEKVPHFRIFRRDWSFFLGGCWFLRESHFRWLIVECCYDARINCNYSIQTYFFSARELIFTESDVLVSPAFDDKTSLLLIVKVCLNHIRNDHMIWLVELPGIFSSSFMSVNFFLFESTAAYHIRVLFIVNILISCHLIQRSEISHEII